MNEGKRRILLLGPERDAVSGVSTHLNQLFGSRLADQYELQHFVVGSEGRRETGLGKLMRLLVSPFALAARIIRTRPDIVHINVSLDNKSFPRDAIYLAVARALRRRVVFQVHGGELPQSFYQSGFLRDQVLRRVLRAADVVVLLARSELEAYSAFVPGQRLTLIANGTEVHDAPTALPRRAGAAPLRLTYVGRFVATKGVAECIAAAHLLDGAGRDFTLRIAGAGPQEPSLRAAADPLIRTGKVQFVGPTFGADKDALWRDTDVFLFPTSHREGLPYALLESMAAGAVPITTRVGAHPDVVVEGVHGLFIEPGDARALFDAIVTLDDDRLRLASMSRDAMVHIRRDYSVERLSAEFDELYRSL